MSSTRREVPARLAGWFADHPLVLPLLLVLVGAAFRFYNLDWDHGHQLHPDERAIYMTVAGGNGNPPQPALGLPTSWSQFLDATPGTGSPLDPHFFAYGSLPFYLLAALGAIAAFLGTHLAPLSGWADANAYGNLPTLGRGLSATLDLASVFLVFLLGRKVFGYWTSVVAMALATCTVLDIQLSHFYAVDTVLLPLSLLTLLAAVHIAQTGSRNAYLWGGLTFGASLATKTTALLLIVPLGSAGLLFAWNSVPWRNASSLWPSIESHYQSIASAVNRELTRILALVVIAALTFCIFEPYALLDRASLVTAIAQQTAWLVNNDPPFQVPFTIQYAHTTPYLFQAENLMFWCLGIPLGLAALFGLFYAAFRLVRCSFRSDRAVLLLWVVPYFLFVGRFLAKFDRYMLPIIPVMTILGAALLVDLVNRTGRTRRRLGSAALLAVVGGSFVYSLAYMNIYAHPNTRVAASRWIFAHAPAGSTIAVEGPWDDPLPMDEEGHSGSAYHEINLDLYAGETTSSDLQHKIANITNVLGHARYIVMSSERMIGSIPRLPGRYPIAVKYYELLFAGKLNFRLAAVFQQHPQLGPLVVHDYPADESFHVYDHPLVRVWQRTRPDDPRRVASLLMAAVPSAGDVADGGPLPLSYSPDTRLQLTTKQWQADVHGPTFDAMFPPAGFAMQHPIIVWLLVLELLGLLGFPFAFMIFGNLLDRGWVIAKTVGLLVVGYLVWIAVSLGLVTFEVGPIVVAALAVACASAALAFHLRREISEFWRTSRRSVLGAEAVFLVGFGLFVLLRMWYPDLGHQFGPPSSSSVGAGRMGEKQMELAFLNAIVRSRVFPPFDPFFAHGYINYYYYGFFLVGMLCKVSTIAPAVGFNLALATFFALLVGSAYSVGAGITRRIGAGIVAAIFVGLLGNLNGAWQTIRGLMSVAAVHSDILLAGGIVNVLSGLRAVTIDRQALPPFDFWESTRIIPPVGGDFAEFPYFTFLFGDLHAHAMSYPLVAAVLALAVNLLGPRTGKWRTAVSLVFAGLLLGTIAATNPWDYPTYTAVLGMGAVVGAFALRRRISWRLCLWPAVWTGVPVILSSVLFGPLRSGYQTVFDTGLGMTRSITPAQLTATGVRPADVHDILVTPLRIYVEHFGLFMFVTISFLIWLLVMHAGLRERVSSWKRAVRFAVYYRDRPRKVWHAAHVAARLRRAPPEVVDANGLTGVAIVVLGLIAMQYFLLAFVTGCLGLLLLVLWRLRDDLDRYQLFVLVALIVPLALSIGTQIFFVKDFLANGPAFRMNTIFKFYDQAWLLFAICSACALSFMSRGRIVASVASHRRRTTIRGKSEARPSLSLAQIDSPASPQVRLILAPAVPVLTAEKKTEALGGGSADVLPRNGLRLRRWSPSDGYPRVVRSLGRHPLWSSCLALLLASSLIYTYAGTVSRETLRFTWLPESSVPFTLDGMAFMKVAYPGDYAGIRWLNAHVAGSQVEAEASNAYYNWKSRVSQFTGLPTIYMGFHEPEQRWDDQIHPAQLCAGVRDSKTCLSQTHARDDDAAALYDSPSVSEAWQIIHRYGVRYIFMGSSETVCDTAGGQCFSRAGLAKFPRMVGHGLAVAFSAPHITIYRVTAP